MFESKSISRMLSTNFDWIREAHEALYGQGDYADFLRENEEILDDNTVVDLKVFLEGLPFKIGTASEALSRQLTLQYAYLLTRYAEKSAGENRFENALFVLCEACYYSGLAQGICKTLKQDTDRPNSSLLTSHAAKSKHAQQSAPVKQRLLELLESQPRREKWNSLTAAIRVFDRQLTKLIEDNNLGLKPENLPLRVASWCKKDMEFKEMLSRFVILKD